ncbi:MAG: metallophosphoesterase [Acidobacteriota bacterium]|nr:metallophosphoesterase [Acidobacteriota bacterium]
MKSKCLLKTAALAAACVITLLLVWGIGIEPRLLEIKEETAKLPNLPRVWEGKRVALIADLQVGMWLDNTDAVRSAVKHVIAARPAAVLIAGDFVYNPTNDEREETEREEFLEVDEEVNEAVALVRPLVEAGIETYAVLGNHDYGMMTREYAKNDYLARRLGERLSAAGVSVLDNAAAQIASPSNGDSTNGNQIPSEALYVVGIGDSWAHNDRVGVALAQVPGDAARIAFMHNPDSFSKFPPHAAPLALAGHTHGGQIRLPFLPRWSWMSLVQDNAVYADGWITNFGQTGNHLYVNRGIGFSNVPVRINCRPELTIFTLRRASTLSYSAGRQAL